MAYGLLPVYRDVRTVRTVTAADLETAFEHVEAHRSEAPNLSAIELHGVFIRRIKPLVSDDADAVLARFDVLQRHGWGADVFAVYEDVEAVSDGADVQTSRDRLRFTERDVLRRACSPARDRESAIRTGGKPLRRSADEMTAGLEILHFARGVRAAPHVPSILIDTPETAAAPVGPDTVA